MDEHTPSPPVSSATSSHDEPCARRRLLSLGAASLTSLMLGTLATACGDDDATSPSDGGPAGDAGRPLDGGALGIDAGPVDASSADASDSSPVPLPPTVDAAPLNALLELAYRRNAAYEQAKQRIAAAPETDPRAASRAVLAALTLDFQSHHQQHIAVLIDAIRQQRGTPITEAEALATFVVPAALTAHPTLGNVLKFLASTERSATVSHNLALDKFVSSQWRYLSAVIEGTAAQHFAVLLSFVQGLLDPTAALTSDKAARLVLPAFLRSVAGRDGLDETPASYFM